MAYSNYYPNYYQPQPYFQPNSGAMPDTLNQFKGQYQTPVQQMPPIQAQQPPQTPNNDIIWVQGEAGAKAYLVAPNTTVTLWDSENQTIYIKSADASGIPSMRTLDWKERNATPPTTPENRVCNCEKEFVKISDFQALQAKFDDLEERFNEMSEKTKTKPAKVKEETVNE